MKRSKATKKRRPPMNNREILMQLPIHSMIRLRSIMQVELQRLVHDPEFMAAFEEWKAKQGKEAENADKH